MQKTRSVGREEPLNTMLGTRRYTRAHTPWTDTALPLSSTTMWFLITQSTYSILRYASDRNADSLACPDISLIEFATNDRAAHKRARALQSMPA